MRSPFSAGGGITEVFEDLTDAELIAALKTEMAELERLNRRKQKAVHKQGAG